MTKPRRVARRGLRFTREGRVFVLVTLGVGAAAVNTGNNLLYLVLGLMLSLIVLSGVLSDLVLWWVRARRTLPSRAFAGTPCAIELGLANDKRFLPSFSIEVEDQAESEATDRRCYFLKVAARAEQVAAYRRTPLRRGPLVLTGFRLSTRYPFGLFEKWRLIDDRSELLVYPALVPVVLPPIADGLAPDDRATVRPGHGTEVAGLREYREGDDARAISWRRSASLGRIVVRERERESGSRLTILLDNREPEERGARDPRDLDSTQPTAIKHDPAPASSPSVELDPWDQAFEDAVSRAASLADRALRRGAAVDVVSRTGASPVVLPGAPADPIFRWLARVRSVPAQDAPPLPDAPGAHALVAPERGTPARGADDRATVSA